METKHTPTPWHVDARHREEIRQAETGGRIASTCFDPSREECEANAVFIVTAVNAHAELVAVCREQDAMIETLMQMLSLAVVGRKPSAELAAAASRVEGVQERSKSALSRIQD